MKSKLFLFALIALFWGCSHSNDTSSQGEYDSQKDESDTSWDTLKSGVALHWKRHGKGEKVQDNHVVIYNYHMYNAKIDRVVATNQGQDAFVIGMDNMALLKGLKEGLLLMRSGDICEIYIPSAMGFGAKEVPKIPANTDIKYSVELLGVKNTIAPFDTSGIQQKVTGNGIVYYPITKGKGEPAEIKKKMKVNYQGYLLDGRKFDSSVDRGQPFEFNLGLGEVIPGWEYMVKEMREGDQVKVLVPWHLAYGKEGTRDIPPMSDLVFDIELIEVKKPF